MGHGLPILPGLGWIFTSRRPIDTRLNRFPNQDCKLFDNASTLNLFYLLKRFFFLGREGKGNSMTYCSVTKKAKLTQVCRCAFCFSYNPPFPGITSSVFIFIYMKTFQPKAELHFTGCSRRAYSPVPRAVHLKGKEKKRFAHLQCRKRGTDQLRTGYEDRCPSLGRETRSLTNPALVLPSKMQSEIAIVSVSSSLNLPYAKTWGGDISQSSCKFNKFIVKQFFIKDIGKLCPYSGLGRTDT